MDLPYKIRIMGLHEIDILLGSREGGNFRNIISFGDPGSPRPPELYAHDRNVLRIECKDVFPEDRRKDEKAIPRKKHVEQILEYGRALSESHETILIHCHAGVSRSTAAALILLFQGMKEPNETAAVQELIRLRARALPNKYLIHHADSILSSNLMRACEPVYRTRAARIMNLFRREARRAK